MGEKEDSAAKRTFHSSYAVRGTTTFGNVTKQMDHQPHLVLIIHGFFFSVYALASSFSRQLLRKTFAFAVDYTTKPKCCIIQNSKRENGGKFMKISDDRLFHIRAVAEYMFKHAFIYDQNPNQMYLLGFLHDIGYVCGDENHEQNGAKLLGEDNKFSKIVAAHGMTPQEYMDTNGITESEIPKELILLWEADMVINSHGAHAGFQERLKDVRERYGIDSKEYNACKEKIEWLKNRKGK